MSDDSKQLLRLSTGVPGLDRVLWGGLFERSVYIVEGPAGSGKTILGNQMCHHHAGEGHQAVYFTLLAESHARMIHHLRGLSFFRTALVGELVHYISGFRVLVSEGLPGLLRAIRETVVPKKARLVVMDGLLTAVGAATSKQEYEKFVHELQALAALAGCTVLLLVSRDPSSGPRAEDTIVDGVIELTDELSMLRPLRHLQVKKLRGSDHVRGKHTIQIDSDGISLLPRIEAHLLRLSGDARLEPGTARVGFGLPELDHMLSGGLPACSTTQLLGATGTGKTILALQFLAAGAALGAPGLFFGFFERPHTLIEKSRRIGLGLDVAERRGLARFAWEPFGEGSLDALGHRLLGLIEEHHPQRLVIDGLQGFQQAAHYPERLRAVLSAIVDALEAQHITTLYTVEAQELFAPIIRPPISGISAVTHNLILLRHVEVERELTRVLSIIKVRDASFDGRSREFRITDRGIVLDAAPAPASTRRRPDSPYAVPPPPPQALPGVVPTPKPYVVIVDDEFGLAELISEVLADRDYSTAIAINGELGLALMRERRPDLVLLDLMMPVLTGQEMLRQMRADPNFADIPVVIMTALPGAVPADELPGHQAVLQKPFTPERLFEVVRASLRTGAEAQRPAPGD
jgi:circadian clock protein KaiC